jgi:hypothetical protein
MVIRVLAVPDSLDLFEFDEVFRAVLGWENIGFLFRVHGQGVGPDRTTVLEGLRE